MLCHSVKASLLLFLLPGSCTRHSEKSGTVVLVQRYNYIFHFIETPVWFTELTNSSITINWDLQTRLPGNLHSEDGRLCECKTTGIIGDLIPNGDCRCVPVSLLSGEMTFAFDDASTYKTRASFFEMKEGHPWAIQRRFLRFIRLPG